MLTLLKYISSCSPFFFFSVLFSERANSVFSFQHTWFCRHRFPRCSAALQGCTKVLSATERCQKLVPTHCLREHPRSPDTAAVLQTGQNQVTTPWPRRTDVPGDAWRSLSVSRVHMMAPGHNECPRPAASRWQTCLPCRSLALGFSSNSTRLESLPCCLALAVLV